MVECNQRENLIEMTLKIKEAAVEGQANEAVKDFLADELFGISTDQVEIVRGQRSKDKYVKLESLEMEEALSILRNKGIL